MQVTVDVAPAPHKFTATVHQDGSEKTVHFGRRGDDPNNDFPHHKDAARMIRYLVRHGLDITEHEEHALAIMPPKKAEKWAFAFDESSKEDWKDPTTAGFWSRWLLWSRSTPRAAVVETKKRLPKNSTLTLTAAARRALREPWE